MRIKLFENFTNKVSKEDIKTYLIDLIDDGFNVDIVQQSWGFEVAVNKSVVDFDNFKIVTIINSIITLTDYLSDRFGDDFDYTLRYYALSRNKTYSLGKYKHIGPFKLGDRYSNIEEFFENEENKELETNDVVLDLTIENN